MKLLPTEVDNGIFNKIRKVIVNAGYLPDFTDYMLFPDPNAAYQAAKLPIINSGKEIIEVHNSSSSSNRGERKEHMVYVTRLGPDPSSTGVGIHSDYTYNELTGKYDKTRPSQRFDLMYQIAYVTNSETYASLIESFIAKAFSTRVKIIPFRDDYTAITDGAFWLYRGSYFDVSSDKYIERGSRFTARYIDIIGPEDLGEIAKFDIAQFQLDMKVCDRETILKKLLVEYDASGNVSGYTDVYKIGLTVVTDPISGNEIVVGPGSENYLLDQDTGEIIYLDENL